MGTVGLYDADIMQYNQLPFNLELMKLSTYYKKRLQIVSLAVNYTPKMYNKFFYRKDYYDGFFPKQLTDVSYGGRAFNQDKYVSLPEDIECQKPDRELYERLRHNFVFDKETEQQFKTLMIATHFRLSLDGENVWNDFDKQLDITPKTSVLFLHDYNLNDIKDSDVIIKDIMRTRLRSRAFQFLGTKFPIKVSTGDDLFKWWNMPSTRDHFTVQINGLMKDEEIHDLISLNLREQENIRNRRKIEYVVTDGCSSEKDFIINILPRLFKHILYLRDRLRFIRLTYDPYFFQDKRWEDLIKLFELFIQHEFQRQNKLKGIPVGDRSFGGFLEFYKNFPGIGRTITAERIDEILSLVRFYNSELYQEFFICKRVFLKGGQFYSG